MGIRVLLVLSFVGLMLIGCSEADQPSAAEAPAERQAVEPEQEGEASEVVRTTSRVQVDATQPQQATNEPQQQPSDQTGSDSEPPPTREEPRSPSQSEAEQQGEPTESQEEPESPPTDLTDVPATVIKDADVRVRPGLPWPVIERLSAGDEVVILNVATGWYRISYGDEREGWIRTTALDLGVVEPHRILHRPAPAIVAEWRGEQYGVMGQSADGAEVRLLPMDEELAEIVGAPINEVTLLADDITVRDLPILIGDETVVFAGDDFRVGLGRILPKANEWMWLPWGWLLAHNDSHIWQWRPETDELEFIQRTPGQAALSADGRHLAILSCGGVESCHPVEDVTIMPLDGSPIVSLRGLLNRAGGLHEEKRIELIDTYDLSWSPDGSSLLVGISEGAGIQGLSAVLFDASGAMTLFEWEPEGPLADKDCFPNRYPFRPRYELWQYWAFSSQDDVRIRVICTEDDELVALWAAYGSGGEFHRLEPDPELQVPASDEFAMIAADADQLGDDAYELGDGTDRYSIVVEPQLRKLFIYDEGENQIREVNDDPYVMPDWLWELLERGPGVGYQGWDLYWSTDNHVAVISRTGITHIAAALLVDLTTAIAVPLPIGSVRTWPCYPTGDWSPDGSIFQMESHAYSSYEQLDNLWIDGVAASRGEIYQRVFVESGGKGIGVLRAFATRSSNFPPHLGRWSPDGGFFAIGGHQELHHCYTGA